MLSQEYQNWISKYANKKFEYFGRHDRGYPINYEFNSTGYRGPEHCIDPDISVFGSSFSFGVGMDFSQCWHQQLGDYRVNCYAPAGILVTNNDIVEHYLSSNIKSGIVILQLREVKYNTGPVEIPRGPLVFAVDEIKRRDIPCFTYQSFQDRAVDQTHPGPLTHKLWAKLLKTIFNL